MFEKYLKRSTWADIIISMIFILFGVLFIVRPEETRGAISILIGIVCIAMGIVKLIEYYSSDSKDDSVLTFALLTSIIGVAFLFAPQTVYNFFQIVLGIWIVLVGVMNLQTILAWKEVKSPYWTTALVATILMISGGIVIIVSQNILTTVVGVILIVCSVLDIIDRIIFMQKVKDFEKND